ncbi:MAG: hypothetical protein ABIH28_01495 [archaeon]
MIFKNKKAFISILEAFIAITLIMTIVVLILQQDLLQKRNISAQVYTNELEILRGIQINETYRAEILNSQVPTYWTNSSFPDKLKGEITLKKPAYLTCTAKICEINQPCFIEKELEKDVYAQSVIISANATLYSPREFKLFCWER